MRNKKIIIGLVVLALLAAGYGELRKVLIKDSDKVSVKYEEGNKDNQEDKDATKVETININNINLKEIDNKKINFTGERTLYYLNLALSENDKRLKGYEVVKFKNNYNSSLKDLVFHIYADSYNTAETKPSIGRISAKLTNEEIGDIKIDSLKINDKSLAYTEDNQILKVTLDKELKPGETVEAAIEFTIKIPKSNDRLGYIDNQISLTNWYPILSIYNDGTASWDETPFHPVGESNYSDCSDYKVSIYVPKGMVVAGTGISTDKVQEKSMDKLSFEALNNRDFVLFMSKDYKVISSEVDGIKINSYYFDRKTTAERMLNLACESIKFFNSVYGKYPYPEYDVVETYLQGGAMEYPTATQMGPYTALNSDYRNDRLTFFDEAVVHETGHQWWYSTVGNNEFKEPILDETFTAYATALFFEKEFGEYNSLGIKASFLAMPLSNKEPIARTTDKYNWRDFSIVIYRLGPVVLEDLRQKVGEEKFTDIFKTYYEKYKFKNATLESFLEIVKDKCGSNTSDYIREAFTKGNYSNESMRVSENDIRKIQETMNK